MPLRICLNTFRKACKKLNSYLFSVDQVKDTYKDIKYSFTSEDIDSDEDTFHKETHYENLGSSKGNSNEIEPKNPDEFKDEKISEELMVDVSREAISEGLNRGLINDEKF